MASAGVCRAQDRPETPDTRQPAQAPAGENLPDTPAPEPPTPQSSQAPNKKEATKKNGNGNPMQSAAEKTREKTIETLNRARDWEASWITGVIIGRDQERIPLTAAERRDYYLKQTFTTPGAYAKRMLSAGFDQVRGVPYQWDDGWTGYMERFASRYGQFAASNSLAALGNAKLKYEPRYDRCRCDGFWPRVGHAVIRNFLTYNEEGQVRPQWGLYGGAFGGGLISTAWKPRPRNAFAEGGRAAAEQGGYGVAWNLFLEFAGDINRKLGAKK